MPDKLQNDPAPPQIAEELGDAADRRGRPYKLVPVKTILRRLKSLQQRVLQEGEEAFDPSLESKRAALISCLVYEYAMLSDDEAITLPRQMDWVLRSPAIVNMLQSIVPKNESPKFPRTEDGIASEIQKRNVSIERLKKIAGKSAPVAIEQVLQVLTPKEA